MVTQILINWSEVVAVLVAEWYKVADCRSCQPLWIADFQVEMAFPTRYKVLEIWKRSLRRNICDLN